MFFRISGTIILLLALVFSGCTKTEVAPTIPTPGPTQTSTPTPTPSLRSFTDDAGNVVNLPVAPQRIVSIGPEITEILVALGASEKIVGVDNLSQLPANVASVLRLGEPFIQGDVISPRLGIDTNAIVSLHPDLVIASVGAWVRASESIPFGSHFPFPGLDKAGIPTVCLNPTVGVTGALKLIRSLGTIVGESDKANQLVAGYEKRKQTVVERIKDLPKVRVALVRGVGGGPPAPGPPVTEDEPLSELIQLAGGVNVFTSSPEDKNMLRQISQNPFTVEPYIAKNPEAILVLGNVHQMRMDRPDWEKVDAVKKGRVYEIIGSITPLTVLDRLEEISRLLHPVMPTR